MKKVLIFLLFPLFSNATTYYVATPAGGGSNSNDGLSTITPFATWEHLSTVMGPGDIGYIRGGTYTPTLGAGAAIHCYFNGILATVGSPARIENYPGEVPVFDLTGLGVPTNENPKAVVVEDCSYVTFKGLRVTGLAQHQGGDGISLGWQTLLCANITHELISVDHIGGYGFKIAYSDNCTYLNCDAWWNDDRWSALPSSDPWGGSDGFGGTGGETSTNTLYDGCRAWWNSDDGFDFFGTDGIRTMKNCWSFWNGYQPGTFDIAGNGEGYKMGPTATAQPTVILKFLENCIAYKNRGNGFNQNTGNCRLQFYNCTSYKNGLRGFWLQWNSGNTIILKNNIAWDNPSGENDGHANAQGDHNTWNGGVTVNNSDFLSITDTGLDGPRQPDGSLPNLNFLKLITGSDLINAGVDVGLPYNSTAPDMGAFEFSDTPPATGNYRTIKRFIKRKN